MYTLDKFKGNKENKCFLNNCSYKESVDHIFGECPFTTENYDYYIKMIYKNKYKRTQSIRDELIFMQGKSLEQKEMISIFKMAVWALRNTYKNGRVIYFSILMDLINLFKRRFALFQGANGESYSKKVGLRG